MYNAKRRSIKHPTVEIPHSCFLRSLEEPSWAFHRFVATRCRTRDTGGLALCWSRHEGFKCRVRFCSNWSQRVSIHVRLQNTTTTRLINPVVHAYAKLFSNESSSSSSVDTVCGIIDPLSVYQCSMWRIGWHLIWIDDWNWDWDSVNWKTQLNISFAWISLSSPYIVWISK